MIFTDHDAIQRQNFVTSYYLQALPNLVVKHILYFKLNVTYLLDWLVGCIGDLRCFSGISAISRLGSRE